MSNAVLVKLAEILDAASRTNVSYHGKMYRLDDADIPVAAAVQLVTREIRALLPQRETEPAQTNPL